MAKLYKVTATRNFCGLTKGMSVEIVTQGGAPPGGTVIREAFEKKYNMKTNNSSLNTSDFDVKKM